MEWYSNQQSHNELICLGSLSQSSLIISSFGCHTHSLSMSAGSQPLPLENDDLSSTSLSLYSVSLLSSILLSSSIPSPSLPLSLSSSNDSAGEERGGHTQLRLSTTGFVVAGMLPIILVFCIMACLCITRLCCAYCRDAEDDRPPPPPLNDIQCHPPPTDISIALSTFSPQIYTGPPATHSCVICLDDLLPEASVVRQLRCGPTFHCECIDQWLVHTKHCPLCLQHIATAKDVRRPTVTNVDDTRSIAAESNPYSDTDTSTQPVEHPNEVTSASTECVETPTATCPPTLLMSVDCCVRPSAIM